MRLGREYQQNLEWINRSQEFERDQKAIILSCSLRNKIWTKYAHIEKKSGLSKPVLFDQLVYLIKINVIKLKVDQNKEILFALRERLENK